jgi:rubredoxin
MELWGHCTTCDRWFYCPTSGDDAGEEDAWHCPVCGAEPTVIENRAAT